MICTNCKFDSPPGMRFCGMCGAGLSPGCPACGYSNPVDFQFCGMCGASLPAQAAVLDSPSVEIMPIPLPPARRDLQLDGERRLATVMVTDLTGSSSLLEKMGTENWVTLMNRILRILEAEVHRFGGHVDQFRGDGLLAFFGVHETHEDDPERAVLAALAMQRRFNHYIEQKCQIECRDLRMRVGLSTGEVIIANLGDSQRPEETGMGMTVALAARLEQSAEPGSVLVSEATYRQCKAQFEWQALGEMQVKGISQPVRVYRPLVPVQAEFNAAPSYYTGYTTALVLRETEFQALRSTVDALYGGVGGITVIMGERGMGKSLMVNEMFAYYTRQDSLLAEAGENQSLRPPLTWLRSHCRSYDRDLPYAPWLYMLRYWLGARADEPMEEARLRLRARCESLWGGEMSAYYPYLASFLGLPLEEEFVQRVKHLNAEGLRSQYFLAMRSWVDAQARQGALVLMFSDMHWADTSTIDLMNYCLPVCDDLPVLWLLTLRPEHTAPVWTLRHALETDYPHRLHTIQLNPFTEEQSGAFIDYQIGEHTLPEETRALVIKNAVGNPYYIEELLQSLVIQKALVHDENSGEWKATRVVSSLELPESLHSLLLAHIDRLSPEERRVLQLAAIIGQDFWYNVLQALADPQTPLKTHLAALQRAQMIRERGTTPELGMLYSFKTSLIREAAYESLLTEQRAAYHLQVTAFFENNFSPEFLSQHYSLLAYQYQCAGLVHQELDYVIRSADQARSMYANAEALKLYTRALALLDEMERASADDQTRQNLWNTRFQVLQDRREVLAVTGDPSGVEKDAAEMLELAQRTGYTHRLIDALLSQPAAISWKNQEECHAGMPIVWQALDLARHTGDKLREMRSLQILARQYMYTRNPEWRSIGEEALQLARELNDRQAEARILISLGTAYSWSDQPERGSQYLALALPLCREMDDKTSEVNLLHQMALQLERQGDYYQVLKEYQEKRLRISRMIGYRAGEVSALIACGQVQSIYLGDHQGGIALLEEARRKVQGVHDEITATLRITQIKIAQGEYQAALQKLSLMDKNGSEEMFHNLRAGMLLVTAMAHNAFSESENHLRTAHQAANELEEMLAANTMISRQYGIAAACQSSAAHLSLAALQPTKALRKGCVRAALEASQRAMDLYSATGYLQIIECTSEEVHYRHSRALAAAGRLEAAHDELRWAHEQMMRKYDLIPADSPFRRTYLENIPLHRDIRAAYQNSMEQVTV